MAFTPLNIESTLYITKPSVCHYLVKTLKNNNQEYDLIPGIKVIDGKTLGHPDYYMRKLEKGDPRALIIGSYIRSCCNSIDDLPQTWRKPISLRPMQAYM